MKYGDKAWVAFQEHDKYRVRRGTVLQISLDYVTIEVRHSGGFVHHHTRHKSKVFESKAKAEAAAFMLTIEDV